MHERTQKAICRLVFVFACAVPTLLTMTWIAITWTPWFYRWEKQQVETELTKRLGLRVAVERFSRPAPGMLRLEGVVVAEPETFAEVARVRLAVFANRDRKNVLQLHQPELQSAQLAHAWQLVHDRYLCQPDWTEQPMVVTASALTVHSQTGGVTFRDTVARIVPGTRQVEGSFEFLPAGRDIDAKAWIGFVRDRQRSIPETRWRLYTGGVSLPVSALADYLPPLRVLGRDAEFNGSLEWKVSTVDWSVDLKGATFSEVELNDLLDHLPHKWSGKATVQLDNCTIRPGQSLDVSGSFVARRGYIGTSLLQAAQQHLGVSSADLDSDVANLWYELCAMRFDLYGTQLRLSGNCHQHRGFEALPPGTLLAVAGKSLAIRQQDSPIQATALVSALAPKHAVMIPYSRQTAGISRFLLPPEQPPAADAAPVVPRITLRQTSQDAQR